MIPFLHLGPLTIPTFGLMVATGLLAAAYVLQADFNRRRAQFQKSGYLKADGEQSHHDDGFLIIGIAGLAGLIGARLYHVLESPRELIADPSLLISRFGLASFLRQSVCTPRPSMNSSSGWRLPRSCGGWARRHW